MVRSNDVSSTHVRLRLAVHTLTKILVITAVVLIVTSLAGQYIARALDLDPQRSIFYAIDVNNEGNIPAGFATLQLLICAFTLTAIAAVQYLAGDRWTRYWTFLALVFLGLAWDEATAAHETLISPAREMLDLSGIFYFAWIVPAFIVVALFGFVYLRFVAALPPQTHKRCIIAALMFFSAVFLLEGLGGWHFERVERTRACHLS